MPRLPHPKWIDKIPLLSSQQPLPGPLSAIPPRALRLIALLVLVNAVVWAVAGVVLRESLPPHCSITHALTM
jgi:hypothetical protein